MPKIFSDEEKQADKHLILGKVLQVIAKNGYKQVTVDQLAQMIGVSKGYFYVLFPSKEDFFLTALAWQMEKSLKKLEDAVKNGDSPSQISKLYRKIFKNAVYPVNYEDIAYVQKKISDGQWQLFRSYQEDFFSRTLKLLGKNISQCDPKVISNLSAVMFLLYNSDAKYLFTDKVQETTDILLHAFLEYIFGEKSGKA